jgi:hypothetical protein
MPLSEREWMAQIHDPLWPLQQAEVGITESTEP